MSSPAKKRKLNSNGTTSSPAKGLEYFFSKQRQNGHAGNTENTNENDENITKSSNPESATLTDEELARKLQAEWDKEAAEESGVNAVPTQAGDVPEPKADLNEDQKLRDAVQPAQQDQKPKTLTLQSAGNADDTTTSSIPLDESPLSFQPSQYIPELQKHWNSEAGDASYALLTRCFVLASATNSRIKIVDTMTNCLRLLIEGDPTSLLPAVSRHRAQVAWVLTI
jgi:DNA ligase-1